MRCVCGLGLVAAIVVLIIVRIIVVIIIVIVVVIVVMIVIVVIGVVVVRRFSATSIFDKEENDAMVLSNKTQLFAE